VRGWFSMRLFVTLFLLATILGYLGITSRHGEVAFPLILLAILLFGVAGVVALAQANSRQRLAICLGICFAALQVLFPPTVKYDLSTGERHIISTKRRLLDNEHTYHEAEGREWISAQRQTVSLFITAAVTSLVLVLLQNRTRRSQSSMGK
jgi:hypothetical protein